MTVIRARATTRDLASGEYNAAWWGSDGAAILLAYAAAAAAGKSLYIPAGDWSFASAATFSANNNVVIRGDGSANTNLIYAGASTTADCFTFGDAASNCIDWNISGLTFRSSTTMTAGTGVVFHRLCRSVMDDVTVDGQDGTDKFYHGIAFRGVDDVVWNNFEARANQDVVQVSGLVGALPKADLFLSNYKIGFGEVGVRCGGAFGGLYLGAGAIAGHSSHGVVIDETLVAEQNREVFVGELCAIDANGGSGVYIDQSTPANCYVELNGWISSNTSHGVHVVNYDSAKLRVNGYIYNNTGDGLRVDDVNAFVHSNAFYNLNGGWGINPTVAATGLSLGADRFISNTSGTVNTANVSPSTSLVKLAVTGAISAGAASTINTGSGASTGDLTLKNDHANGPVLVFDCAGTKMHIRITGSTSQILNSAFSAANLQWTDAGAFTARASLASPILNSTSTLGYSTGAGGTVAQGSGSGKATGVTLNKATGLITMDGAVLNAATIVSFTLTNSTIAATDTLILNHASGGTVGAYTFDAQCGAGSAVINVRNATAGNLTEAPVIRFTVIKSVSA